MSLRRAGLSQEAINNGINKTMEYRCVKPNTALKLKVSPSPRIAIVGFLGNLGRIITKELVMLCEKYDCHVILLGRDRDEKSKGELLLTDANACQQCVCERIGDQKFIDILLCCAGINTRRTFGPYKKQKLFSENYAILRDVFESVNFKYGVLATNPCTELVAAFSGKPQRALLGIGVENDNIRFAKQFLETKPLALVGAHALDELVPAVLWRTLKVDLDFACLGLLDDILFVLSREYYESMSREQDNRIVEGKMTELVREISGSHVGIRWWLAQRANTVLTGSVFSAVAATMNVLHFLCGWRATHLGDVVYVETELDFEGRVSVLGWPFSFSTTDPEKLAFTANGFQKLLNIREKYCV